MKTSVLFGLMMLPVLGSAQVVDTTAVIRQVDSIIQVSRTLTGQRDFDRALEVNASAEKLAQEKLGHESVAYGSVCANRGRVLEAMKKYPEAEQWYLEALSIREKILGKEHPDYAYSLCRLAELYVKMRTAEKAEHYLLQALAIYDKVSGKEHIDYVNTLYTLAFSYLLQTYGIRENYTQLYEKAEIYFLETKELQEKIIGKIHLDYAKTLTGLANVYGGMNKYEKAEPLHLEALSIREQLNDTNHHNYGISLNNLGNMYMKMGKLEKAEQFFLRADTILVQKLGKENMTYAANLRDLALLYPKLGKSEKAESLHHILISIAEKIFGKEHEVYIAALLTLGEYYLDINHYEKAEHVGNTCKVLVENVFGKEDIDFAYILNFLGRIYLATFNPGEAEKLFLESVKIKKSVYGNTHPEYAVSLGNLAHIYRSMGNYVIAEAYLIEVLTIHEQAFGKQSIKYAEDLMNLGNLYHSMSNYEKSETFYLEARTIAEKAEGNESITYGSTVLNLAILYLGMGNHEKAEPLFFESLAIVKKAKGNMAIENVSGLACLGKLYTEMGNYEKAEDYFLEAKAIYENAYGKEHTNTPLYTRYLADLYEKQKRFSDSEPLFKEVSLSERYKLSKAASFLSARELAHYTSTFQKNGDALGSNLLERPLSRQGSLPELAYDRSLFYKGFLLITSKRIQQLALSDNSTAENFNLLKSYEHRLAAEYSKPITERKFVADLEANVNTLEKELARTVAGLNEAMQQVTWKEVQSQLNPTEAAVEFIQYSYYDMRSTDSVFYSALVLLPGDKAPVFVPLFQENEIVPLLKSAKGTNFQKINALYAGQSKSPDQKTMYDLIWKPLEARLHGIHKIYCSPSGLLHKINLGAININDEITFSDRHQVVVLNSTRQLVSDTTIKYVGDDGYIAGGVRYTLDSNTIESINAYYATRSMTSSKDSLLVDDFPFQMDSTNRGNTWNYLPQTATEAIDIHQLLLSSHLSPQLDTGYYATEESFRSLGINEPSPRILHIATHGFFFPDPKENISSRQLEVEDQPVFKISEDPMMRSGLILAGAQQAWTTGKAPENREDGILTAYEISQMNLSNTELVVLSACETGLGDIEGNEGVYGLQRAFKIAGAKYLVMSLWKVNDQSTRELMIDFYRQWLINGMDIPGAFRTAQNNMKRKYPDAPYHWAGFVLME